MHNSLFEFEKITNILFSFGLFANAILFLPQALKIYKSKNINGLSIYTFAGFNVIQLLTIIHGLIQKDYILAFGFLLSFISCGLVTLLILFFGRTSHGK